MGHGRRLLIPNIYLLVFSLLLRVQCRFGFKITNMSKFIYLYNTNLSIVLRIANYELQLRKVNYYYRRISSNVESAQVWNSQHNKLPTKLRKEASQLQTNFRASEIFRKAEKWFTILPVFRPQFKLYSFFIILQTHGSYFIKSSKHILLHK